MGKQLETPVALVFFTRAETLEKVFSEVRKAQPQKLFLIQDGPRANHPTDEAKIMECRKIVENVDWECEIYKNYSEVNLGCGKRPASGITWVFEHVEKAIIVEDDCVPCPTFFQYCEEMLNRYENDERISYISGLNHFQEWDCGKYSYFFAKTGAIWGWATWRRAWQKYDYYVDMIQDSYIKRLLLMQNPRKDIAKSKVSGWDFVNKTKETKEKLSYWDVQWGIEKYSRNQLVIIPKYNQINNIGVGENSTHAKTTKKRKKFKHFFFIPTRELEFPLVHQHVCMCDMEYDRRVNEVTYGNMFMHKVKDIAKQILRKNRKRT